MRLIKRLLLGALAVLALLVVGLLLLVWTFDANTYRDEIATLVEQRTGRSFAVDGSLSLTFYPWLGLALEDARLGNAQGFGDQPMARVERVHLAARLWPLLAGQLELGTVTLRGLELRLQRAADGRTNWQDLTASPSSRPARLLPAAAGADSAPPPWLRDARLAGLDVREATVVWDDRQAGQRIVLDALDLSADDIRLGRPVPLTATGRLALAGELLTAFDLDTRVEVAEAVDQALIRPLTLTATVSGPGIPGGSQQATVTGEVAADIQAGRADIAPIRIEWGPVRVDGQAAVDAGGAGPRASGRLQVAAFSPRKAFDILEITPPETADSEVLKRAAARMRFDYAGARLAVTELQAELDDSTLTGSAMLAAFAPPDVRFELALDQLNADRYLPPGAEDEPAPSPGQAAAGAGGKAFEPLRTLRLDGVFDAGRITVSGAELTEVHAEVRAEGGALRVHPLRARLYGGEYHGDIRVDARGEQPRISLDEELSRVQAQPLLRQFAGKDLLRGLGSLSLDLEAAGVDLDSWLRTATGQAAFRFEDGAVKGINLAAMLRGAVQRLQGGDAAEVEEKETDFTQLSGTVRIDRGVVRNDDLTASSPLLRVKGKGQANLRERTVDYLVTVNVVNTLKGQGGDPLEDLRRVPVPVRFKGPMLEPEISLDLQAALTARQKARLEEEQKAVKQQLQDKRDEAKQVLKEERKAAKEKAKEKLQNKLEGLLNR